MDTMTRLAALAADCMKSLWPDAEGLPAADELRGLLAVPPDPAMGDYAFPCFRLAKPLRMAPPKIAEALCGAWDHADIASVQPVNGYMNFFLNRANFAAETMAALQAQGDRYGSSDIGAGKTVCLDYSSINIAKRFHIGHLSSTMIGHSLKRIFSFLGYNTVGINHLGDWGTQFGKMVCAYKKWGRKEDVEERGIDAMTELYVRFHREAENDPALEDEGRAWFKKIEDNDPEAMEIFRWFKEVTLKDAAKVYDQLGVAEEFPNWDLSREYPVQDIFTGAYKADALREIRDHIKARNPEFALGTEWLSDCTSQYCDFVHIVEFTALPESFPEWFRYTFPEVVWSDRCVRDDNDVPRRVNNTLLKGLRNDIEVFRCRGLIDETPVYQAHLAKVNALRHNWPELLLEGRYTATDGFRCSNAALTARSYSAGDKMAVVVPNTV